MKNHQLFITNGLIILFYLVMPGTGNPTHNPTRHSSAWYRPAPTGIDKLNEKDMELVFEFLDSFISNRKIKKALT